MYDRAAECRLSQMAHKLKKQNKKFMLKIRIFLLEVNFKKLCLTSEAFVGGGGQM